MQGERARETHTLLHPAGKIGGPHGLRAGQSDHGKRLFHARLDLRVRHATPELLVQPIGHVVPHRQRVEEGTALEQVRDLPPNLDQLLRFHLEDVATLEQNLAPVGR